MSSYDDAREAAVWAFVSEDRLGEDSETACNAILDAFLGKLSETHAVVPRVATEEMMQASRNVSPSGEWRAARRARRRRR